MNKKRILLINQGNSENLGDKSIKNALCEILKNNNCDVDFVGFSQLSNQEMELMNSKTNKGRELLRKITPPVVVWLIKYNRAIKSKLENISNIKYDLVLIGGGQLIKTKCVFPYVLYTWFKILNKNVDCPKILFAIGADNKFTKCEQFIYKKILPKFDKIFVRDYDSKNILLQQFNVNANYVPDVVFLYSKYFPYNLYENKEKNIVVLMIYNYDTIKYHFGTEYRIEDYYQSWLVMLKNNINNNSKVYLAYTTVDDKIETIKFADYLENNTSIDFQISYTDNLEKLIELLGKAEKVITGRMHAMILGLNYKCKVVPYIVSSKIKTFQNEWLVENKNLSIATQEIEKIIYSLIK